MRKRDGFGGLAALLVLIAMIVPVTALLVFGVMAATDYLPRH
ncbi:hypothetical protein ACFQ05_30290 [Amycolatopsis umgeniensis]|uniref:Archaellin n=1 Tax=Amycolatopsis umgeniensis TaxID=336628 RepID=A0A841BEM8_9PSEU|nr:hypothetical protein [Amycolatopsis umgeniensis]MBB5857193.1 archaellin [Amycolatopsis umgeniensis]